MYKNDGKEKKDKMGYFKADLVILPVVSTLQSPGPFLVCDVVREASSMRRLKTAIILVATIYYFSQPVGNSTWIRALLYCGLAPTVLAGKIDPLLFEALYASQNAIFFIARVPQIWENFKVPKEHNSAISVDAPICYAHLAAAQMAQFVKFDDMPDAALNYSGGGSAAAAGGSLNYPGFILMILILVVPTLRVRRDEEWEQEMRLRDEAREQEMRLQDEVLEQEKHVELQDMERRDASWEETRRLEWETFERQLTELRQRLMQSLPLRPHTLASDS